MKCKCNKEMKILDSYQAFCFNVKTECSEEGQLTLYKCSCGNIEEEFIFD